MSGQQQVEDDEVRVRRRQPRERRLAVADRRHVVAVGDQAARDEACDALLVLDDEHARGGGDGCGYGLQRAPP